MRAAPLPVRLATLALAAVLASTIAYWALQVLAPRPAIAPATASDLVGSADPSAAARLFGGAAPAMAAAAAPSNLRVAGVAASDRLAAVLLSIDGQPARVYGVGDALPDGAKVVSVGADRVVLERGGARIELAAPARPSVALLTSGPRAGQPASSGGPGVSGFAPPGQFPAQPSAPGFAQPPAPPGFPTSAPGYPPPAPGVAPLAPCALPAPGMPPGLAVAPVPGASPPAMGAPPGGQPPMQPGEGLRGAAPAVPPDVPAPAPAAQ